MLKPGNCAIVIDALIKKESRIFDPNWFAFDMQTMGLLSEKLSIDQFKDFLSKIDKDKILIRQDINTQTLARCLKRIDRSKWLPFLKSGTGQEFLAQLRKGRLDLKAVLKLGLDPEESAALLIKHFSSASDITSLMYYLKRLSASKREDTLIAFIKADPSIIDRFILERTIYFLGMEIEDPRKIIQLLRERIDTIINGQLDRLRGFLHQFSTGQCDLLLPHIIDKILPFIKTKADFDIIRARFTPETCASNPHFQLFSTVFAIAEHPLKEDDTLLKDYVEHALANLRSLDVSSDIAPLQLRLSAALNSVSSIEVRAVKQYMAELIQKAAQCGFSGKSYRDKVTAIQDALLRMPLDARGTVLTGEPNPVQTAICKGRLSGQNKSELLDKVKRIAVALRDGDHPAPSTPGGQSIP